MSAPTMPSVRTSGAPASLGSLFALSCRWKGQADFLVDDVARYSGDTAERLTRAMAQVLAGAGLSAGDRICFLARSSAWHVLAWFAGQRLGAVAVNLHILETDEQLAAAMQWLEAKVLACDAEFLDRARKIASLSGSRMALLLIGPEGRDGVPSLLDAAAEPSSAGLALDQADGNTPAAIVLSSGSTGRPKGVVHSQRTLVASALAGSQVYGWLSHRDAVAVFMGTSYAAWANVVLPFVAAHAKVVFRRRFMPEEFLATLEQESITVAPLVPTMWRMVLAAGSERYDLARLRCAMFSGEPGARKDVEALAKKVCQTVHSAYLSTEGACASGVVADQRDLLGAGKPDCAGKPIAGADLRIVDPAGTIDDELPPGEVGEIAIRSASVAVGYWKDEPLTRQKFVGGWWRSGDLGRRDADGIVFVQGRLDNLINSGGIKIHAEEVELALLRHPAIRQAAVIGRPDETWGQRVEAFVVVSDRAVTPHDILEYCRRNDLLPAVKLPKQIHILDKLPTGPTGKLYRKALMEA